MKETAAQSHNKQTQDEAFLYTITCTYNNKYDWRFPTIYEFIYSGLFTNLDVWNIENVNNPYLNIVKAKYMTLPIRDIKRYKEIKQHKCSNPYTKQLIHCIHIL